MEPLISIIIPFYNNPDGLLQTLKSLVVQEFDYKDFEIIVVDNGSTDNTLKIAENFARKFPKTVRIVTENNIQSSYAARNKGIEASRGSIIAFIDVDMTVGKDWLRKIAEAFNKNIKIDYLACKVDIYLKNKNIFELYDKMTGFPIEKYITYNHFAGSGCLMVRKALFNKVGSFDYRLISGGDYEFGNRVFEARYKLYYEPRIVMRHPARSTLKQLLKKFFRVGRGLKQLFLYYPVYYSKIGYKVFDIRYYFPHLPWKFYNSMKGNEVWDKVSFSTKIGFYFINWVIRLAKHFGYIYESRKKIRL